MLRTSKFVVVALAGALAMSACEAIDQNAIQAEKFSQSTIDDPKEPIGPGSTINVESFEWGFRVEGVAIDGPVTVNLNNIGGATHNFRIDNAAGDNKLVEAGAGEEESGELKLFGGATYTYYCDIPGHRSEGMEGELVVYLEGEAPADSEVAEEDAAESDAEIDADGDNTDQSDASTDEVDADTEGEPAPNEVASETDEG